MKPNIKRILSNVTSTLVVLSSLGLMTWASMSEHNYGYLFFWSLLVILILIGVIPSRKYRKVMERLPGDHKLFTQHITVVDVGNYRFFYHIYQQSFFLGHYRISISVNLPLPPEKENEAELAESFLSRLMAILRHYDLENNSLQWVEKMRNPEGYDPRRIWVGIPVRIEYPLKGLDAQKLVNLQNEFTELISDHYLTDLSYCTILGTNKGTVYSRIRGNLQASSLYTDAFQNPSVIYQSIPILSSARPWLLENESLFNPSQYDEIMRNAHLDPSAGSCRISQLGSVIKDMFKGYGRKIIVRYNQSKERFMLSLSIPSRKSASEYAIISSTGYWWFSASGRLDQIDPVSTESESAACDLLIRVISKYL